MTPTMTSNYYLSIFIYSNTYHKKKKNICD